MEREGKREIKKEVERERGIKEREREKRERERKKRKREKKEKERYIYQIDFLYERKN